MTAVTVHTPTSAERFPRPRGLVLAMLRLHRSALWFWLMLVTVAAGTLLRATVPGADAAWAEYTGMGCDRPRPNLGCDDPGPASVRYQTAVTLGTGVLGILPLLTGAWAGGALVGRERENGTAQLAWTQSVTPRRWLAVKPAAPAALLTAGTGGLVLLNVRARGDGDPDLVGDWYTPDSFVSTGPTAVAYVLAGLALGALAGLLWRRALPAAGTALAASLVLHSLLERFRADLRPTVTRIAPGGIELPRSAFQVSWDTPVQSDVRLTYAEFQPRAHFWPLQYMESGILLAVAATATGTAFALLARRLP